MKSMPCESFLRQSPALAEWYERARRDLPWRRKNPASPYETWISEVMSQQSTMASVVPYFERWMKRFPRLEDLAAASEAEVLKAWTGLGYYSRARNVLKGAKAIQDFRAREQRWPQTAAEWQKFSGIGPYTAAAVAAIAFGDPVLPVDGNVYRVLSRFARIPDPLNSKSDKERIHKIISDIARSLPQGSHGIQAQALMELGAQVCRPGAQAQCTVCPLQSGCLAARKSEASLYPKAKIRPQTRKVLLFAPLYREARGPGLLMRKIPSGQRLEGHWEIPLWEPEAEVGQDLKAQISKKFSLVGPVRHQILNNAYEVYGIEAGTWTGRAEKDHAYWSAENELPGPVTTLTRKLLKVLQSAD